MLGFVKSAGVVTAVGGGPVEGAAVAELTGGADGVVVVVDVSS